MQPVINNFRINYVPGRRKNFLHSYGMLEFQGDELMCQGRSFVKSESFTLVELLVVIAIIAMLVAILTPAIQRARASAQATRCRANLHSIGQAIKEYMLEHHDYYPPMAIFPSIEASIHPNNPRLGMSELLKSYASDKRVFRCPDDRFISPESILDSGPFDIEGVSDIGTIPSGVQTWFEWQGSSYEPLIGLSIVDSNGRWQLSQENRENVVTKIFSDITTIPLVYDYEQFHPHTSNNSIAVGRMVLFADFHVGAGE